MLPAKRFNGQTWLPDFFNDLFENASLDKVGATTPAINVVENDNEYRLELAAPGMTKDDFKVHVNKDGNLVIEMEKKECECKDKKECKFLRREFSYSRFRQTLLLPDNADREDIEAHAENGILYVKISKLQKPKVEEERRFIEVK